MIKQPLYKQRSLAKEISNLLGKIANVKYSSFQEAASELADEYQTPNITAYPAIIAFRDIDFEFSDPRYKAKFDLKLLILKESTPNNNTQQSQEEFPDDLYDIEKDILDSITDSPVIICDHFMEYKSKEFFGVNKTGIVCDCLELTIPDLKLIK